MHLVSDRLLSMNCADVELVCWILLLLDVLLKCVLKESLKVLINCFNTPHVQPFNVIVYYGFSP